MADDRAPLGDDEFKKEADAEAAAAGKKDETPGENDAPPASDKKEEEEIIDEDKDDVPVPIRKSTAQQIIARKNRQIEKLRSKDEGDAPDADEADDEEPGDEGVEAVVRKHVAPIINTFIENSDEGELKDLFTTDPEAKKYEKRIRAFMKDPHWKAIPPAAIYHHLAFGAAAGVKQKEKKKEVADVEAAQSAGAGSQRREVPSPTGDIPSADEIDEMSDADFEVMQNKARSGGFVTR